MLRVHYSPGESAAPLTAHGRTRRPRRAASIKIRQIPGKGSSELGVVDGRDVAGLGGVRDESSWLQLARAAAADPLREGQRPRAILAPLEPLLRNRGRGRTAWCGLAVRRLGQITSYHVMSCHATFVGYRDVRRLS